MRTIYLIGVAAIALPLCGGEFAVLTNGSRLHAERHETDGSRVRLFTDAGVTEMPLGLVARFEQEEFVPAAVPPSPAPVTPVAMAAADTELRAALPQELAVAAAKKYALPSSFVASVMKTESAFRPAALSPKGAIGLMQLMPGTARTLGVDPKDPKQNAEGGAQYLHDLLAKYEDSPDQVLLALAAYNAGPAAVDKYHGVPPYRETREYILRVLKGWDRLQTAR